MKDANHEPQKGIVPTAEGRGYMDPFRLLSESERRRHLDAYQSHLEVRNGRIGLEDLTLSRREDFFSALAADPIESRLELDSDAFYERFEGRGRPNVDARILWLLTIARANEGESYGVALELERFVRQGRQESDPEQLYVFMEEQYHGRLLEECCRTLGFDIRIKSPRLGIRLMCRLIYYLPEWLRSPLVLCSEAVGTAVFGFLLSRSHLFSDQPELESRLRALLTEIWRDEVLHVAFLRARMGPTAIRAARRLLPSVVSGLVSAVPELAEQGCGGAELIRDLQRGIEIPPSMQWLSPDLPVPA
jgi:hypothetical protein